jgi:hypothetical protein
MQGISLKKRAVIIWCYPNKFVSMAPFRFSMEIFVFSFIPFAGKSCCGTQFFLKKIFMLEFFFCVRVRLQQALAPHA